MPSVTAYSMRMGRKLYLPCLTTANWTSAMHGQSGKRSRNSLASWVTLSFVNGEHVKLTCNSSRWQLGYDSWLVTTMGFWELFHVIYSYFLAVFLYLMNLAFLPSTWVIHSIKRDGFVFFLYAVACFYNIDFFVCISSVYIRYLWPKSLSIKRM